MIFFIIILSTLFSSNFDAFREKYKALKCDGTKKYTDTNIEYGNNNNRNFKGLYSYSWGAQQFNGSLDYIETSTNVSKSISYTNFFSGERPYALYYCFDKTNHNFLLELILVNGTLKNTFTFKSLTLLSEDNNKTDLSTQAIKINDKETNIKAKISFSGTSLSTVNTFREIKIDFNPEIDLYLSFIESEGAEKKRIGKYFNEKYSDIYDYFTPETKQQGEDLVKLNLSNAKIEDSKFNDDGDKIFKLKPDFKKVTIFNKYFIIFNRNSMFFNTNNTIFNQYFYKTENTILRTPEPQIQNYRILFRIVGFFEIKNYQSLCVIDLLEEQTLVTKFYVYKEGNIVIPTNERTILDVEEANSIDLFKSTENPLIFIYEKIIDYKNFKNDIDENKMQKLLSKKMEDFLSEKTIEFHNNLKTEIQNSK